MQGELERACRETAGHAVAVAGAGRTDAGVHAVGQVAAARMAWTAGPDRLAAALNARLPADVAVVTAVPAPARFDPRRQAVLRRYRYAVYRRPARSPFLHHRAWHRPGRSNLARMRAAARCFVGRHDFSAFCTNEAARGGAVRLVRTCTVATRGSLLLLDVAADGFLHRMVRFIAGAIIVAGEGRRSVEAIRRALREGARAGRVADAAPPQGLCLLGVRYPGDSPAAPSGWPGVEGRGGAIIRPRGT